MRGCEGVKSDGMTAVIEKCTELSLLDVSGCCGDFFANDGSIFEKPYDFDLLLADHKTRLVMVVGGTKYVYRTRINGLSD